MLFAVGTGTTLATAKECYERQKKLCPPEQWDSLPARYALVELNNLHDDSLEFEPIHRVVFGVDPEELLNELRTARDAGSLSGETGRPTCSFTFTRNGDETGRGCIAVNRPSAQLPVGTLKDFWTSI